ncbi:unconventional myosin-XVIIIa-like isoform X2 [Tigriopus californicus]|uniref:unconventional myosin-XVIIIa-like isoform X2 n=1 Tax=Tigriopus californicus TaxID=6832 RepID=UPI0027DA521C|nr:unconventional myosin-XVIIIa-like isoform X2 [Tigriopus californicus]XP_059090835.1 unconventional myosin-XVIIIa-like isoform X2 [Tigriopus californicus]
MFNFMKKDKGGSSTDQDKEEKERKRREKKKKHSMHLEGSKMTSDELQRLDEVRKSLKKVTGKLRKDNHKLPSGIIADYRDTFDAGNAENVQTGPASDSSSTHSSYSNISTGVSVGPLGITRPTSLPPPIPPSRGILKGQNYNGVVRSASTALDDPSILLKNTQANEYLYEGRNKSPKKSPKAVANTPMNESADREVPYVSVPPTIKVRAHADHVSPVHPSSSSTTSPKKPLPALTSHELKIMLTGENIGLGQRPLSTDFSIQLPGLGVEELDRDVREVYITPTNIDSDTEDALGTYGLTLKRVLLCQTGGQARNEPGQPVLIIESSDLASGIYPGDQVMAVNGIDVSEMNREAVNEIFKELNKVSALSGGTKSLTIKVKSIPELWDLGNRVVKKHVKSDELAQTHGVKRSEAQRFKIHKAKSEEQLASERAFLEAERVWLVHKDGFAAAGLLKDDGDVPEGKVRVQLDYNGDIIEVEEDDVERANPTGFDKVEDLAQLRYLNESSALHTLRQRYGNSLIHTFAGPTIIAINPMAPLSIYSDKVIEMFKECKIEDMPPHIYTVAATAHRDMLLSRKDQSIVLMGRSGSGKTVNLKHVLHYFAVSANNPKTGLFTPDRVQAISTLLEAFGNTRTIINANATRFSSLFSIDFDPSGQIASASLQTMLLEKSRVVRRPDGEPNFNIFYQMLAGLDTQTRLELHLDNLSDPNLFMTPLSRSEDKTQAAAAWGRICTAITIMKITPQESFVLWSILAAIYHLGVASVARGNLGKTQFAHPEAAQRAAECLGTTVDELTRSIFQGNTSSSTLNRKLRSTDKDSANLPDGIESLEAFVMGLYQDTFNTLVFLINRAISTNASAHNSILVVDAPGFQNSSTCGRYQGGTFEDLCHNYVQERLQLMFHERSISSLHDKYIQEKLDCDLDDLDELPTPAPLVALIDKQAGTRVSQSNLASADRRGLLWLLDEEALFPGATDESFVERLLLQYNQRGCEDLLKKGPTDKQFVLQHFQGTNPVLYNANGWLQASREDGAVKAASVQLQDSSLKPVSELFCASRGPGAASVSGSIAGLEGNHSLRRASSIRRGFTTGGQMGMKRHSVALQVKFQVDTLMEQLRRTKSQFVHCFIPQHNSGLCDVKGGLNITKSNGSVNSNPSEEILMNVPLVRSQLRGAQILDAVRLHKNGFPESMNYSEFWRKFRTLGHEDAMKIQPTLGEMKEAVGSLLEFIDLDKSTARLGNTQVFLRAGVLAHLQEERDEKLTDQVVRFQALCRGHLARKRFQRRKTQDIAIRCIQKNVRKFMGVRDWPWWRLLVKLTPLLNVHRTEDQLKSRTDELEMLKARLEKVEKERTEFKQANEKLENRLSEMTADLAEEHSTATLATERLEAEQAERLKLEKEKNDLTSRNKQLLHSNERMEMEVLYSRALDMNGSADSDEDGEPSIFKQKYERAIKELEFTKKRLAQQHDDDMEQLMALKKQLEKKLHDAFDEVDEQRQNVAQWKRKAQKAQGEMNDTKLLLEEQTSRNLLLEKKQRKFDAEINSLQEDRKQEKTAKDKFYRELDDIKRIKYSLEDEITAMKLDLDYKDEKISALSKELEDLHSGGTTDEEVSSLKRQKNDLEKRLKEQEEELDDMAGQVQMLEQAKIKLEMSMAALKKDHRREISSKEDELEDARNAAMKKVKALEQQLESEHEERIGFVREKHELETKIINLQDLASRSTDEDVVAKLKKDLKRTKALLKDAQYMLERSRNETSNKSLIRQLKNQLEDAEFARISAIKAKQNTDLELSDVQQQLDDVMRSKSDVEDKLFRIGREKADLATQLEDNDSELSEVMKKYKASVGQLSVDQITIHEQANAISDLEEERNQLKEQLAEFTAKVQSMEGENVSTAQHHRLELKIKELESKLDLEQTTRGRMETQINRLKEAIEKINIECDQLRGKEHSAQELVRKLQRQLRDLKEEFTNLQAKETEVNSKKNELEKMLELAEAETVTAKNDLKLAMKRIEDLQTAMNGEIDSDSDSILSDGDSDSSDDDVSNIFDRRASHLTRGSISRTLEPMPEEPESQLHEGKSRPACHDSDSDADPSSGKPSQALLDETDRTGESQA